MSPTTLVLASLCFTSAMLAIIFWIAWRTLGRERHALTWSIAFAVGTLQWFVNLTRGAFPDWRIYWTVANGLALVVVTLAVLGHRQRAGLRPFTAALVCAACVVELGVVWSTWISPHAGLQTALDPVYAGLLLAWCAWILVRFRPRPLPAEVGAAVVHLLFGLSQAVAGGVALLQGAEPDQHYFNLYLGINFSVLPSAYVGMGLFVVLILASDLAERMRQLALTDALTGLLNRRGFTDAAVRAVEQARGSGRPLSLVLGDLDRFKSVNDTWGHDAGDRVLRLFAEQMRHGRRAGEVVARIGGEEFAVLLPNADEGRAVELAEGIRRSLHHVAVKLGASRVGVTASFGVASLLEGMKTADDLVNLADRALYRAKETGRDRVECLS